MTDALVSVILPTYNRAHSLKRAVNSVLAQTYTNLELIVIDDGSTDGTLELLAGYNDPRLIVVASGKNGGAAAARNKGLDVARGEYIAFQDSDDQWLLNKLERQVAHLQSNPDVALSVAGFVQVPLNKAHTGYRPVVNVKRDTLFLRLFPYGHQFSTPSWLVRRQSLDQAGKFDENMPCWEDWELSIRLDRVGKYLPLDEPLHVAFDTPGSVKFNEAAYIETMEYAMRKHGQLISPSRRVHAQRYWMMGTWKRITGDPESARRYFFRSIMTDPTFVRPWLTMLKRFKELFLSSSKGPLERRTEATSDQSEAAARNQSDIEPLAAKIPYASPSGKNS